jgi:hypothetical protein
MKYRRSNVRKRYACSTGDGYEAGDKEEFVTYVQKRGVPISIEIDAGHKRQGKLKETANPLDTMWFILNT